MITVNKTNRKKSSIYKLFKLDKYYCIYFLLAALIFSCIYLPVLISGNMYMYIDIGADTYCSYLPMYAYDKSLLSDFSKWDFSLGLGATTIGYAQLQYLFDPFSWIVFLFDKNHMDIGLFLSLVMKNVALWHVAFLYLRKMGLNKLPLVVSALTYSFCGWMVGWGQHYNFATVFVLFAYALYFLEKWIADGKWLGYVLSLALLLMESPYFAYMSLLFFAVYYLFRYFGTRKEKTVKTFFAHGSLTVGICVLGIGISAFVFIPMCIQMLSSPRVSGNVVMDLSLGTLKQYITLLGRMVSNNIFGTNYYNGEWNFYEAPFMYVGILSFYGIISDFKKNKNLKSKFWVAGLIVLSLIFINVSCILFNGFSAFSFRWTYLLVPIISLATGKGISCFKNCNETKIGRGIYVIPFMFVNGIIILAYWYFIRNYNGFGYVPEMSIVSIMIINSIYFVIFVLSKNYKMYMVSLSSLVVIELVANGYSTVNERSLISQAQKENLPLYDETGDIVSYLESNEQDFYRVYKKYDTIELNDAMAFGFNGEKYYSSSLTEPYYSLKSVFSLPERGANYFWGFNDRQVLRDISASRYMASKEKEEYYGYTFLCEMGDIYLYENDNCLPFGILYETYISEKDFNELNPLEKQDVLYNACVINAGEMEGLETLFEFSANDKSTLTEMESNVERSEEGIEIELVEINSEPIVISFKSGSSFNINGTIYDSLEGRLNDGIFISTNGIEESFYSVDTLGINRIYISISNIQELTDEEIEEFKNSVVVYQKSTTEIEENIQKNSKNTFEIVKFKEDYISGMVNTNDERILYVPIVYDENWHVRVNGQEMPLQKVNIGFSGVFLQAGNNEVIFYYTVPFEKIALAITIVSMGITAMLYIAGKRKKVKY